MQLGNNFKRLVEVAAGNGMAFKIGRLFAGQFHKPLILGFNFQNDFVQIDKVLFGGPVSFAGFETAYKALTAKLRPKVYEYGLLK